MAVQKVHGGRAGTPATISGRTLVAKLEWQSASGRRGRIPVAELELVDNWNSATLYWDWRQREMGYLATRPAKRSAKRGVERHTNHPRPINQSHGQTTKSYITETWR